jgi:hypothetical protein
MRNNFHRRVTIGVELETYTIVTPEHYVSRQLLFPRKGLSEKGERFTRDWSIGSEYNSRPFNTIREGLFLLKAGLRKYNTHLYRRKTTSRKGRTPLLVGGWRDRFAGTHIHLALTYEKLTLETAKRFAYHLHDHIPLLIAMGANSPVWADEITETASNRIVRASQLYFRPIRRNSLTSKDLDEMLYSRGRITKPPTLELRVMDANIPEYAMAAVCVVKAIVLGVLRKRKATNLLTHKAYLNTRGDAALKGMASELCWNGRAISASEYLDRFVWVYREELSAMDIPQEMWTIFKLLKKGVDGSRLIHACAKDAYDAHPQTWQRRFCKRYAAAIDLLLSGNTILDFTEALRVATPDIEDTWLGRRKLKLL